MAKRKNTSTKKKARISATVTEDTKRQLNVLRTEKNTTYADLIRKALHTCYGIYV